MARTRPAKRQYGPFGNVRLSDDEYAKLKARFPDADTRIDDADTYLEAKGDKYKSHYAMLLCWERLDEKRRAGRNGPVRPREYDHEY